LLYPCAKAMFSSPKCSLIRKRWPGGCGKVYGKRERGGNMSSIMSAPPNCCKRVLLIATGLQAMCCNGQSKVRVPSPSIRTCKLCRCLRANGRQRVSCRCRMPSHRADFLQGRKDEIYKPSFKRCSSGSHTSFMLPWCVEACWLRKSCMASSRAPIFCLRKS
jgi:hypothetical protein